MLKRHLETYANFHIILALLMFRIIPEPRQLLYHQNRMAHLRTTRDQLMNFCFSIHEAINITFVSMKDEWGNYSNRLQSKVRDWYWRAAWFSGKLNRLKRFDLNKTLKR